MKIIHLIIFWLIFIGMGFIIFKAANSKQSKTVIEQTPIIRKTTRLTILLSYLKVLFAIGLLIILIAALGLFLWPIYIVPLWHIENYFSPVEVHDHEFHHSEPLSRKVAINPIFDFNTNNIVSWKVTKTGLEITLTNEGQKNLLAATKKNLGKRMDFYIETTQTGQSVLINEPINGPSVAIISNPHEIEKLRALLPPDKETKGE